MQGKDLWRSMHGKIGLVVTLSRNKTLPPGSWHLSSIHPVVEEGQPCFHQAQKGQDPESLCLCSRLCSTWQCKAIPSTQLRIWSPLGAHVTPASTCSPRLGLGLGDQAVPGPTGPLWKKTMQMREHVLLSQRLLLGHDYIALGLGRTQVLFQINQSIFQYFPCFCWSLHLTNSFSVLSGVLCT